MIRKTLLTLGVLAVTVGAVPQAQATEALMDPSTLTKQAPETFLAKFETSKGDFVVEVTRAWAPLGADRFYNLVKIGYFTDAAFFRVLAGFMAQAGFHGDPAVSQAWLNSRIKDDPVTKSNSQGMVTFAMGGPNTRSAQIFINYGDNSYLDSSGFAPFGQVVEGFESVSALHSGYGEGEPKGKGPAQGKVYRLGNEYLKTEFPELDYIVRAAIKE